MALTHSPPSRTHGPHTLTALTPLTALIPFTALTPLTHSYPSHTHYPYKLMALTTHGSHATQARFRQGNYVQQLDIATPATPLLPAAICHHHHEILFFLHYLDTLLCAINVFYAFKSR
uniref:Putative secreted protein n=1 Tax=Ixodes ricinus TaxID=34613 RepID=A0A6B0UMC1_IXORI